MIKNIPPENWERFEKLCVTERFKKDFEFYRLRIVEKKKLKEIAEIHSRSIERVRQRIRSFEWQMSVWIHRGL